MSTVKKDRFIYMYTGKLSNEQICSLMRKGIDRYIESTGKSLKERPYTLIVNAVEDKNYEKKGFAYGWISDIGIFHALLGRNEDGSSRTTYEDDPDWESPDEDIDLNEVSDWGTLVSWGECPQIKKEEPPLITIDSYIGDDEKEHTLDFFESTCPDRSGMKNEIYSTSIPKNISEAFLRDTFSKFCTDDTVHFIKKKKQHIKYPIVQITEKGGKRNCQIEFSPLDKNLASFVLTMTKKLQYSNNKKDIIFFTQSKKRC